MLDNANQKLNAKTKSEIFFDSQTSFYIIVCKKHCFFLQYNTTDALLITTNFIYYVHPLWAIEFWHAQGNLATMGNNTHQTGISHKTVVPSVRQLLFECCYCCPREGSTAAVNASIEYIGFQVWISYAKTDVGQILHRRQRTDSFA